MSRVGLGKMAESPLHQHSVAVGGVLMSSSPSPSSRNTNNYLTQ